MIKKIITFNTFYQLIFTFIFNFKEIKIKFMQISAENSSFRSKGFRLPNDVYLRQHAPNDYQQIYGGIDRITTSSSKRTGLIENFSPMGRKYDIIFKTPEQTQFKHDLNLLRKQNN